MTHDRYVMKWVNKHAFMRKPRLLAGNASSDLAVSGKETVTHNGKHDNTR